MVAHPNSMCQELTVVCQPGFVHGPRRNLGYLRIGDTWLQFGTHAVLNGNASVVDTLTKLRWRAHARHSAHVGLVAKVVTAAIYVHQLTSVPRLLGRTSPEAWAGRYECP